MQFPNAQPLTWTLADLPSGAAGVARTLKIMRDLVRAGRVSGPIVERARSITRFLKQKDYPGEMAALHRFVRDEIRYVRDSNGAETVQTPEATMQLGSGDCDDKSVLLASLLEAIGHPAQFVAVGFQPGRLSHVYVESRLGSRWIPLETTEPVNPGWAPQGVKARKIQSI